MRSYAAFRKLGSSTTAFKLDYAEPEREPVAMAAPRQTNTQIHSFSHMPLGEPIEYWHNQPATWIVMLHAS